VLLPGRLLSLWLEAQLPVTSVAVCCPMRAEPPGPYRASNVTNVPYAAGYEKTPAEAAQAQEPVPAISPMAS